MMIAYTAFQTLVYAWMALAVMIFFILMKMAAPYGRHVRSRWGPEINNKLGWVLMELPAVVSFSLFFLIGSRQKTLTLWIFLSLWLVHYLNRSLIFPFRLKAKNKKISVLIVLFAIIFNCVNGYFNGHYLGEFAPTYPLSWLADARFISGIMLFLFGLSLNWHADSVLIALRNDGNGTYKIPQAGLFNFISCPNYLGELIEWLGFALMIWSLPAFSFFIWTAANLIPRALAHHRWYREQFAAYPVSRKAIIPYVL